MISRILELIGRVLVALLFIPAGVAKLADPAPFLAHMAAHGVPGALLLPVALLEIVAGLAILTGLRLRVAALALGIFCVLTAFVFHLKLADHAERSLFLKDLAIAGGLFVIGASKPTRVPLGLAMLWRRSQEGS